MRKECELLCICGCTVDVVGDVVLFKKVGTTSETTQRVSVGVFVWHKKHMRGMCHACEDGFFKFCVHKYSKYSISWAIYKANVLFL